MTRREVNVKGMDETTFSAVVEQVGQRVSQILNDAKAESDKLLARYNLTIDLSYNLKSIELKEEV